MDEECRRRITRFMAGYLDWHKCGPGFLDAENLLTDLGIRAAVKMLIRESVFTKDELRNEMMATCYAIIPDELLEETKP